MPFESEDNNQKPPSTTTTTTKVQQSMGHQPPPQTDPLHCPRCDSTNTKFCYYNNYNLAQPRHFCKSCRRYWTQGGTLRDVPVGGGSRKNSKRSRSTTCSSSSCSPSSSSLTQEVTSVATAKPVSLSAEVKPEPASDVDHLMDLNENVVGNGGFTSLLNSQGPPPPGFLALGGYGYGYGYGSAFGHGLDEVGDALGHGGKGVWAFPEVGDFPSTVIDHNNNNGAPSGCNTWQMTTGADGGFVDGDCFAWPELEISMMPASGKTFK
ncbi:hypothetical protein ACE6H2_003939 [Prunus campanulata]